MKFNKYSLVISLLVIIVVSLFVWEKYTPTQQTNEQKKIEASSTSARAINKITVNDVKDNTFHAYKSAHETQDCIAALLDVKIRDGHYSLIMIEDSVVSLVFSLLPEYKNSYDVQGVASLQEDFFEIINHHQDDLKEEFVKTTLNLNKRNRVTLFVKDGFDDIYRTNITAENLELERNQQILQLVVEILNTVRADSLKVNDLIIGYDE